MSMPLQQFVCGIGDAIWIFTGLLARHSSRSETGGADGARRCSLLGPRARFFDSSPARRILGMSWPAILFRSGSSRPLSR